MPRFTAESLPSGSSSRISVTRIHSYVCEYYNHKQAPKVETTQAIDPPGNPDKVSDMILNQFSRVNTHPHGTTSPP
jgi:hypothetical protein